MNSEFNDWLHSPAPAPPIAPAASAIDWRYWARRLLVCNPFFLCSAALLLFGVNRLSLDPRFLSDESSKLLFNYSALQLYEMLVVVTAIVLARRNVWYDSALLGVVEHGLVLAPFMLISQGSLVDPKLGWILSLGAVVLVVVRALAVRRKYPLFNLPPRALALGVLFLLLNAALPALFRWQIDDGQERWATPGLWMWYVVLPLLVAGANLLPRPTRYGGLNPERHWLPLFVYALWTIGTAVHFWCLGYISEQTFHLHYLGPAVMAGAWTMWRRIPDCVPQPGARWDMAMLGLTFVAPLVALGNSGLFEGLVLVNAAAYAVLARARAGMARKLLREFLFSSVALLVLGLPEELARIVLPNFARLHAVFLALATLIFIAAIRSSRLSIGIAGACGAGAFIALLWPQAPAHAVIEVTAVFLLAHSLGWSRHDATASFLRTLAGMAWMADAMVWIHSPGWKVDLGISGAALSLTIAWWFVSRFTGQRRDWIVLASALGVLFVAPSDWLLQKGSPGLLALAASFATFAMGVGVAWTRHAWDRLQGAKQ